MADSSLPIINEVSERESDSSKAIGGLVAYGSDSDSSDSDSQGSNEPPRIQMKSSPSTIPPLPPPTLFAGSRALATLGVNLAPAVAEGPIHVRPLGLHTVFAY